MKISSLISDLQRVYDEFGDVEVELADIYDMDRFHPVTQATFDQDRGRVQVTSDR